MVTLAADHSDESHNTLEFATRAKKVVNEVSAVETMSQAALLKRYGSEIVDLRHKLAEAGYVRLQILRDGQGTSSAQHVTFCHALPSLQL
jgi:hypothetical protein